MDSDVSPPQRKIKRTRTLRGYMKSKVANKSIMAASQLLCCQSCKRLDIQEPLMCDHCTNIVCSRCFIFEDPPHERGRWMKERLFRAHPPPPIKRCPCCKFQVTDATLSRIPWLADLQSKMRHIITLRSNVNNNNVMVVTGSTT